MPLIGFTVMKSEILNGQKRQTIRKLRKHPIKVGDTLYLYWHLRRKDCQLLKIAKCTEEFVKPWAMLRDSWDVATRDGFKNPSEMQEWFMKKHNPDADTLFQVIRW